MSNANNDLKLVGRVLAGDKACFSQIVEKYENRVYQTCYRFVKNHEDARDLSQEAFIRAYENLASFRGRSALLTWLQKISVNVCLNFLRKENRLVLMPGERLEQRAGPEDDSPERLLEEKELYELLALDLDRCGAISREIFLRRLLDGTPFREIAQRLLISPGAARMNYSRTKKRLKERLLEYQERE